MIIPRIYDDLNQYEMPHKILVIYGPRRIGKTTLLENFLSHYQGRYKLDSGDNINTQYILGSQNFDLIKEYVEGYDLLVLDEAQRISKVGWGLKILSDQMPQLKVIVTGSSSFELSGQIGEPLTGRKRVLNFYPVSQIELLHLHNAFELKNKLNEWLIFGGYPEVIIEPVKEKKIELLTEMVQSYLLKDILELERIKNAKIILDLLRLLAFQIGNEVSLSELAQKLGIDSKTVFRYLDLLEKSFIIYNLRGFSRNLRKEITKKSKYYFYDNGIRNAIISNFNPLDVRNDVGALWENFLIMERLKKRAYQHIFANDYFWRTWDQKEIDLVEERDGKLFGYEFKWNHQIITPPKDWLSNYPEASFEVINMDNYLEFVA
jgi:uncharacterized protein